MGGVYHGHSGRMFKRRPAFLITNHQQPISLDKPTGYIKINDLDMCILISQFDLCFPCIVPLVHIQIKVYRTDTEGWENGEESALSERWDLSYGIFTS